MEFSPQNIKNKIHTLLTKFTLCFKLNNKNRMLCKHEVALLTIHCSSFGCWLPVNFSKESISRKFHVLTYHVPEKARERRTVGLETEQCSEAIHPVVNSFGRWYHSVQNKTKKLELITKSQWLQSDRCLNNFRQVKSKKRTSKVKEEAK